MGRGSAWTGDEEAAACRAALRVSECSVVGANQRKEQCETRIHREVLQLTPVGIGKTDVARWHGRTPRAICRQWKTVRANCIKMHSKLEVVRTAELSGDPTEDDLWRVAVLLFNGRGGLSEACAVINNKSYKLGPDFPHEAAFKCLDSTEVLTEGVLGSSPGKKKSDGKGDSGSEGSTDPADSPGVMPTKADDDMKPVLGKRMTEGRPRGSKASKERVSKEVSLMKMAGSYATMAESGKERALSRVKELALQKQECELKLFSQPDTDPSLRARYLKAMQRKALEELEKREEEISPAGGEAGNSH